MNRFFRNTRTEKHFASGGDPLRTVDPPPAPAPAGARYTKCDFCGCKLTAGGQVFEMSPEAYAFRDQKDAHARAISVKDTEIADLKREKERLQAELNAAQGSSGSSGGLSVKI